MSKCTSIVTMTGAVVGLDRLVCTIPKNTEKGDAPAALSNIFERARPKIWKQVLTHFEHQCAALSLPSPLSLISPETRDIISPVFWEED